MAISREATIDGLNPGTHYLICVKTSTSSQMNRDRDIRDEENEVCHKVMQFMIGCAVL